MPVIVIDRLERVQVHIEDLETRSGALAHGRELVHAVLQKAPVGQACQRVVQRHGAHLVDFADQEKGHRAEDERNQAADQLGDPDLVASARPAGFRIPDQVPVEAAGKMQRQRHVVLFEQGRAAVDHLVVVDRALVDDADPDAVDDIGDPGGVQHSLLIQDKGRHPQ